jgi:hypothetical protein
VGQYQITIASLVVHTRAATVGPPEENTAQLRPWQWHPVWTVPLEAGPQPDTSSLVKIGARAATEPTRFRALNQSLLSVVLRMLFGMRKLPDDYEDRLRLKLSPERIRSTLSFAGLVLIVYEMAKQAIIEDVREFYSRGFDESGMLYDEEAYSREVKSLDKSVYRASAKWLVKSGAITEEQIDVLERLHVHRKDIAHELPKYLIDPEHDPDADLFLEALKVLSAIRRFWTQIEIDIGTFEDHGDITVDDVQPLSLACLGLFIQAFGEGLTQAETATQSAQEDVSSPSP